MANQIASEDLIDGLTTDLQNWPILGEPIAAIRWYGVADQNQIDRLISGVGVRAVLV